MRAIHYLTLLAVLFAVLVILSALMPAHSKELCPEFFLEGLQPTLKNEKLNEKTKRLCFTEFSVLHSGVTRTPLWSAEHLASEHILNGEGIPRVNAFHEEEQIPEDERATLSDYKRSGYDRGHMSPNGDMASSKAKQETFTLANMVPQSPCNNEVTWESVEHSVRNLATNIGQVYVVTGPAFIGNELNALKGRVLVPTHIWKAVYNPVTNEAMAYWAPNDNSLKWELISITKLKELTGIDPFPALPDTTKTKATNLPAPEAPTHKCRVQ